MLALGSPCKARGAQEYDAPKGGSLDADSAKIGARRHLSMRSIGRALGVDADPATRRSAKAVAGRFQGCELMISFVPGRSITQEQNRTLSAYVMDLFRSRAASCIGPNGLRLRFSLPISEPCAAV